MTAPESSTAEFFEAKYRERGDFWSFARSDYELRRYSAIVAALDHRRYKRAFEPGCSIGVLTERLGGLCVEVVAFDFSATAAAQAAARCSHLPGITVSCAALSDATPVHGFDLIVLSEIGYYFSPEDWKALSSRIVDGMDTGAVLLGAHWLGHSEDHRMTGDEVHTILGANGRLALEHAERHEAFRLDRWSKT